MATPGDGPGAERRRGLCAKLSCSETQREELRAVLTELRADAKGDREAIRRLRKQLAAEFALDRPDEAAMRATQQKIAVHEQEVRERIFDAMMEVHALLDADQRAQLVKVIEHRGLRAVMGHGGKGKGKHGKGKG